MLSTAKVPTTPTPFAKHDPEDISSTALSLISSSVLLWQVERGLAQEEGRMDQSQRKPGSNDNELWFSLSSERRGQEQIRDIDQTAYQATSTRHRAHRSASPGQPSSVPLISTTTPVNKPLPPSPEPGKKKRKPVSLRSLVRRRPSGEMDPSHLQPGHQASPSSNRTLSPEPSPYYYVHQSSRSMPSSPSGFAHPSGPSHQPQTMARAHSSAANYSDSAGLQPYQQHQPQRAHRSQNGRSRRVLSDTATTDRQRPHTWLSATESNEAFHDASEFHLFVEATSGLQDGSLDFSTFSPTSPQRLQGSQFTRGRQNDRGSVPPQHASAAQPQSHPLGGWQAMGYDYMPSNSAESPLVSSSALPRRASHRPPTGTSPNLTAINLELERLGLSDDGEPEDELPDYAQSQAEMSARRRKEATDRARELEARWNHARRR